MFEKVVVVTRQTRLQDLVARVNTRAQAKFYIEHAGGDFGEYQREDEAYRRSLDEVHRAVEVGLKTQFLDRSLVPTYFFTGEDLVVTVGQDGLVANTAKYVRGQPIVAVNPDPARFDGILMSFLPPDTRRAILATLEGRSRTRAVTLGEARLNDGQRLVAFNDLFVGARSHVSARYRLGWQGAQEPQSSSGVLISTGAGCTGWMSSVFNMASGVVRLGGGQPGRPQRMDWEDPRLLFVVREPFASRHSRADIVAGWIESGCDLTLESLMPSGGVIFSDGVEADFLDFNSGALAHVRAADEKARLVVEAA
jgi:NAD kinase